MKDCADDLSLYVSMRLSGSSTSSSGLIYIERMLCDVTPAFSMTFWKNAAVSENADLLSLRLCRIHCPVELLDDTSQAHDRTHAKAAEVSKHFEHYTLTGMN